MAYSVCVTSEGASYLGRLTALQDLDLRVCRTMLDVGMMHLTLLTSLTSPNLSWRTGIADEGTMCLGSLIALRNLDLGCYSKITDIGLRHLASLILLTRLVLDGLDEIKNKGVECLGTFKSLRVQGLRQCPRVSNYVASKYDKQG